jgi:hypothetical protein
MSATENGYPVAVLEAGKRGPDDEAPKTSSDLANFTSQIELEPSDATSRANRSR